MVHIAGSVVAGALVGAAAGAYWIGVQRRSAAAGPWPAGRTVAFFAGLAAIALALVAPGPGVSDDSFFFHAGQHVLLVMTAPPLLALGAPITLLLQTARRPAKVRVLSVLNSGALRLVAHPGVVLVVFVGGLFVLYLTPLYRLSVDNDWVHLAVHVHFLVAGALFAWTVLAIDPNPAAPGFPARVLIVLAVIPAHAVLGLALISASTPIAPIAGVTLPFGWTALEDQQAGTALMWVGGEILAVALLGGILLQWKRAEERAIARIDRMAERTLDS